MAGGDGVTDIARIEAAAGRLAGHARVTPILSSPFLDEIAGRRVLVKAECLQKTGSFKYRGARAALSALPAEEARRGVLAMSSGNHAQGVALAARELGISAVILMPSDAPRLKLENTAAFGAEVVTYDRASEDRDEICRAMSEREGRILIPPYDHPEVIAGQGTCGLEIAEQAAALGVTEAEVVVCCGGGGLASGIALALEAHAPEMTVRPAEPDGFDDMARSLDSGSRETNNRTTGSLQDAILTPSPGVLTFEVLKRLAGPGLVVSDEDALRAMAAAFSRLKLVLEPGGATALAAALFQPDAFEADTVIAVATGGNVDAEIFMRALG